MISSWLSVLKEGNLTLLIVVAVCVVIAIILTIIEIFLKKKMEAFIHQNTNPYLKQLNKIRKSGKSSKEKLDMINDLSKNFFKEEFNLSHKESYSELVETFKKMGNTHAVMYCELMIDTYYEKDELTELRVRYIGEVLESLIKKRHNNGIEKKSGIVHHVKKIINVKKEEKQKEEKQVENSERIRKFRQRLDKAKNRRISMEKAREVAREAIKKGYKKEDIITRFFEKGWSREDIKKIMSHI